MLLKNAHILTLSPSQVKRADIAVSAGLIHAVGAGIRAGRHEETVDLAGKWIMPGMVCAHTHLYSALARGMAAPERRPRDFVDILKKVWWKLDESLDEESVYYSALAGAIEAAKFGTTTLIDHHASPNAIPGSLDLIKEAMSSVGVRGVLCYEVTDRGGKRRREQGLRENERFISGNMRNSHFRGTVGAHASFTLADGTLSEIGMMAEAYRCGVHIHLAEDDADIRDAERKRQTDIVDRLDQHGILTPQSILAHGVHLNERHARRIGTARSWLVHNPRSNMNNAVGYAPLYRFGERVAIGTDGFPADMFEESKIGFFRNRESERKVEVGRFPAFLQGGQRLAGELFGMNFDKLTSGSPADLVVVDYNPPTPLKTANLAGHLLFGMNSAMVESVMVGGRWVVWNRQLVGVDEEAMMGRARSVAAKLWKRMHER